MKIYKDFVFINHKFNTLITLHKLAMKDRSITVTRY